MYKSTFVMLFIIALTNVVIAQTSNQQKNMLQAFKSQGIPVTINAGQMTTDWREFTVGDPGSSLPGFGNDSGDTPQTLYYTNGDVRSHGSQSYLMAYHLQKSSDPNLRAAQEYYMDQSAPLLLKDSLLVLSPLPLSHIQIFNYIGKFRPAAEIVTVSSKILFVRRLSQSNLKQIFTGVKNYLLDNDGKLPLMIPAKSTDEIMASFSPGMSNGKSFPETAQGAIFPYVKDIVVLFQPATQRIYLPNYQLSAKSMKAIKNPSHTFLFYEDAPDSDGMRNVLYVDGHVAAITEAEFQKQCKAQGISKSGFPPKK
jgi:prepilin-type processing-associated H-X9-DG protein